MRLYSSSHDVVSMIAIALSVKNGPQSISIIINENDISRKLIYIYCAQDICLAMHYNIIIVDFFQLKYHSFYLCV